MKDGSTLSVSRTIRYKLLLTIQAFDPSTAKDIVQALRDSILELNPTMSGQVILVLVPRCDF
jgi:ribosome recycling factor